jgi:hypothetical protein
MHRPGDLREGVLDLMDGTSAIDGLPLAPGPSDSATLDLNDHYAEFWMGDYQVRLAVSRLTFGLLLEPCSVPINREGQLGELFSERSRDSLLPRDRRSLSHEPSAQSSTRAVERQAAFRRVHPRTRHSTTARSSGATPTARALLNHSICDGLRRSFRLLDSIASTRSPNQPMTSGCPPAAPA